eukprot:CAMPEP_0181458346 /NCGR_PEP_ID=MMETSP1110-20121109/32264_1 /TAXON_ID=174948 /ORGANISM="Symbiodinium sp., Strain CCMP421" /LENGTH=109 /DNA_ID=CAMNT_0023582835 /DNA_START=109 /DNA_END=440 /DNA_ORIENTATION=-
MSSLGKTSRHSSSKLCTTPSARAASNGARKQALLSESSPSGKPLRKGQSFAACAFPACPVGLQQHFDHVGAIEHNASSGSALPVSKLHMLQRMNLVVHSGDARLVVPVP